MENNRRLQYLSKRGRTLLNGAEPHSGYQCQQEHLDWTWGLVGQQVAEERHVILQAALAKLRDVFGAAWDLFELVRPLGGRMSAGIFENQVDRLMGPRVPFERVERKTTMPLDADALYLLPMYESRSLKLLPLVKIMPAPKTAQNACYFYNRLQKDERIRFVSYHFEQEAEVVDQFDDTLEILELISGNKS